MCIFGLKNLKISEPTPGSHKKSTCVCDKRNKNVGSKKSTQWNETVQTFWIKRTKTNITTLPLNFISFFVSWNQKPAHTVFFIQCMASLTNRMIVSINTNVLFLFFNYGQKIAQCRTKPCRCWITDAFFCSNFSWCHVLLFIVMAHSLTLFCTLKSKTRATW